MQRSRRAILQRRALENAISGRKHRLYKVSVSVVVGLWGLVFLLNLWISHGDGHRDESTWSETEMRHNLSNSGAEFSYINAGSEESDPSTSTSSSVTELESSESPIGEKNELESSESPIGEKNENNLSSTKEQVEVELPDLGVTLEKDYSKNERLSHSVPLALDEFKGRASSPKGKTSTGQAIIHRLETGGAEYNYASAAKGAKVLGFNKEAKGASNILGKDQDKYLRNPCSAEEKFVVIELSEETLVDTIEIGNFEHHSSNLKDFELLGSMVYPTHKWVSLGNFTAGNVTHAQRFVLQEPQWVRYLNVKLLSHYGSEFYCTLSALEVYGVDAVERMLEDLISAQDHTLETEETETNQTPKTTRLEPIVGNESRDDLVDDNASQPEKPNVKSEAQKGNFGNVVTETRPQQLGRMPGDTVLKILMQKVRSLDLNLAILERYLEELNSRYGNIFKEIDDEMDATEIVLEQIKSDMKSFAESTEVIAKDVDDLVAWKSLVSSQMDSLARDNAILRSDVERVRVNQVHMENKGLAVFLVSFIIGCFAIMKLFIEIIAIVFRIRKSRKFCGISSSWFVLLSSSLVVIILSL